MRNTILFLGILFVSQSFALDWVWVNARGEGPVGSCTESDKQIAMKVAESRVEGIARNQCGIPKVKYIEDMDPPRTRCTDPNKPNYQARAFLSQKWECLEDPLRD